MVKGKKKRHDIGGESYIDGQEIHNNLYKLFADNGALFRNFTRMSKEDFQYLVEKITPMI